MSFAASLDVKERIRQSVDIVDLVGSYLPLQRRGALYLALCPWHDDSRPSLQVNPAKQLWRCWVCAIGGDVFSFLMQREKVDFPEALRMLAERAGIPLAEIQGPARSGATDEKLGLYQAVSWAEAVFHQCLTQSAEGQPAREYLAQRGISDESVRRFRLGFCPDRWQWLVDRTRSSNISLASLEAAGVLGRSSTTGQYYERFKGRVVFPIHDLQGRPIAFGGRILPALADDKTAKYVNSPETRLFSKSDQLYGLGLSRDAIMKSHSAVVMEGYTDVVVAHQSGISEAVAVLGTALNERHIRVLRRFADAITLVLDGDTAGQRRANQVLDLFVAAQVDLRIQTLPEQLDPCDFLLRHGGNAFRSLLAGAVDALDHRIRTATAGIDLVHDTHRAHQALEAILQTLAQAPQGTLEGGRLRQQQVLARLASMFRVEVQALRDRLREKRRRGTAEDLDTPAGPTPSGLSVRERELLEVLILDPTLVAEVRQRLPLECLASPLARDLVSACVDLSDVRPGADFDVLVTAVEDPSVKSMLVALEEQSRRKSAVAEMGPRDRLAEILRAYDEQRQLRDRREVLAGLENGHLSPEEELNFLQQLIHQERNRQGIPAPTDG